MLFSFRVNRPRLELLLIGLAITGALAGTACGGELTAIEESDDIASTQELIDESALINLYSFWNSAAGDNALSTNPVAPAGYTRYRQEGRLFRPDRPRPPNTHALHTWYNAARGDYFTSADPAWAGSTGAVREGYSWVRLEGFSLQTNVAGTLPLQLWWSVARLDNFSTSDPNWTRSTSVTRDEDYRFSRDEGYIFPASSSDSGAARANFHHGTMGAGAAAGERPLLVLAQSFVDQPLRHSRADIEQLVFGPAFPNVAGLVKDMSQSRFRYRNAGVVAVTAADDPQTTGDERSWNAVWNNADPRFVFVTLVGASGDKVGAINGGGEGTYRGPNPGAWETFGFVDLNGGALQNGDSVAFKTSRGRFLNVAGTELRAESTSAVGTASSHFIINSAEPNPIPHGALVTLRSVTTGKFLRENAAGLEISGTSAGSGAQFRLTKAQPDMERQLASLVRPALLAGFDYAALDTNGDRVLSRNELSLLIIGAGSAPTAGAGTRAAGEVDIPGTGLRLGSGYASGAGEDVALNTTAHELIHQLGAVDLYGAGAAMNYRATLMGATGGAGDLSVFHLDPWHKLRLGWLEPRIYAINEAGGSDYLSVPQVGASAVLIYDPNRYDTSSRRGEYFLLERRDPGRAGYDGNVAGAGVYIWQCETDASGNVLVIAHPGGGIDASVNTFGNPAGTRGGNVPWTDADGLVRLRYRDGADASIRVRVAGGSAAGTVEWTRDGVLRPRVDSFSAGGIRGGSAGIDGVFPAIAPTVRVRNRVTSIETTLSILTYTGSRITVAIPATLAVGSYDLLVTNGTKESNPGRLNVTG